MVTGLAALGSAAERAIAKNRACKTPLDTLRIFRLKIAEYAPTEGMRGTRFGSARGVTALWRRTCAHRYQFRRERRRAVLDHRPQRRRQDLNRKLHFRPLPADRRPVVLSW